jgi:tetratricopeptide (TPR) repeat protein
MVDVDAIWDFDDPAGSEARFNEALSRATGDDALVLLTQIARTRSLRRLTAAARDTLVPVAAALPAAGPDAVARYWLELGRTWISAVTTPEERTTAALAAARDAYLRAIDAAGEAGLDALAIDAIHMMAFVDTDPADQAAWNTRALDIALASEDPAARRWEASLRNNLGMAFHEAGRDEEALGQFRAALALREAEDDPGRVAIARWMVASALRHLGRLQEAVEIQLRLEQELDAAGRPDPYVFEELERLYRALGQDDRAEHYARRLAASRATSA